MNSTHAYEPIITQATKPDFSVAQRYPHGSPNIAPRASYGFKSYVWRNRTLHYVVLDSALIALILCNIEGLGAAAPFTRTLRNVAVIGVALFTPFGMAALRARFWTGQLQPQETLSGEMK